MIESVFTTIGIIVLWICSYSLFKEFYNKHVVADYRHVSLYPVGWCLIIIPTLLTLTIYGHKVDILSTHHIGFAVVQITLMLVIRFLYTIFWIEMIIKKTSLSSHELIRCNQYIASYETIEVFITILIWAPMLYGRLAPYFNHLN